MYYFPFLKPLFLFFSSSYLFLTDYRSIRERHLCVDEVELTWFQTDHLNGMLWPHWISCHFQKMIWGVHTVDFCEPLNPTLLRLLLAVRMRVHQCRVGGHLKWNMRVRDPASFHGLTLSRANSARRYHSCGDWHGYPLIKPSYTAKWNDIAKLDGKWKAELCMWSPSSRPECDPERTDRGCEPWGTESHQIAQLPFSTRDPHPEISHGWSVMRSCRCLPSSLCFCQFICLSWILSSSLSALSCCTSSTSCNFTAAVLLRPQVTLFLRSYTLAKRRTEMTPLATCWSRPHWDVWACIWNLYMSWDSEECTHWDFLSRSALNLLDPEGLAPNHLGNMENSTYFKLKVMGFSTQLVSVGFSYGLTDCILK